ncbi:unnamed protein product [Ixodes pacificus]
MANPGSSGARACYWPRYAPRKKSEGERGGDRALGSPGRDRAASAGRSGRRTGGGDRRGSGDGRRDLGRALAASGSVPVTPRIRNPRPFLLREERQLAGEPPQRATSETGCRRGGYTGGSPHRKKKKKKKCGDASVAAGVPTLLSLAVIDQLRRRVGPRATVVCAARARAVGFGPLATCESSPLVVVVAGEAAAAVLATAARSCQGRRPFFSPGQLPVSGKRTRSRGPPPPHEPGAPQERRARNAADGRAAPEEKAAARKSACAGGAPRPDWSGVTCPVT